MSVRALQKRKTVSNLKIRHLSANYESGLTRQKRALNATFLSSHESSATYRLIYRKSYRKSLFLLPISVDEQEQALHLLLKEVPQVKL